MAERIINAERMEQIINVFGSFDENIKRIEQTFDIHVVNRDTELKISGDIEAVMILDAMKFCLMKKYEQCARFREALERSKGYYIVEDQTLFPKKEPDTWGVKLIGDNYEGSNLLGRLLMELRDNNHLEYALPTDALNFITLISRKEPS